MTFTRAFQAIAAVMIVHAFAVVFDLYGIFRWWDSPMHFFGGVAMACLAFAILTRVFKGGKGQPPIWFACLFVIGFTALVAVAWEWHEYLIDHTIGPVFGWRPTQPSPMDTMKDLFLGILGASLLSLKCRKIWK